MEKVKSETVLLLLLGALGLIAGVWFSLQARSPEQAGACDLHLGSCAFVVDGRALSLAVEGEAYYTQNTTLLLRGEGAEALALSGWVEGRDMMMGYFPLTPVPSSTPNTQRFTFNLPLCVTGSGMVWLIRLNERLAEPSAASREYRFDLSGVRTR